MAGVMRDPEVAVFVTSERAESIARKLEFRGVIRHTKVHTLRRRGEILGYTIAAHGAVIVTEDHLKALE